jgi:hypothetical protein
LSSAPPSPPLTEYFDILSLHDDSAMTSHFDRLSSSDTKIVAASGPMAVSVRKRESVVKDTGYLLEEWLGNLSVSAGAIHPHRMLIRCSHLPRLL